MDAVDELWPDAFVARIVAVGDALPLLEFTPELNPFRPRRGGAADLLAPWVLQGEKLSRLSDTFVVAAVFSEMDFLTPALHN